MHSYISLAGNTQYLLNDELKYECEYSRVFKISDIDVLGFYYGTP